MPWKQKIVLALKLLSIFLVLSTIFFGAFLAFNKNYISSLRLSDKKGASIFLALDCINPCSPPNYKWCNSNTAVTCTLVNGCYQWQNQDCTLPDTGCGTGGCASNMKPVGTCSSGTCVSNCVQDPNCCTSECASGQTRCLNPSQLQTCVKDLADNCWHWGNEQQCAGSTACGSGTCGPGQRPSWSCKNISGEAYNPYNNACVQTCNNDITCCTNECSSAGQKDCFDLNTKQTCGNFDADPCLDWKQESCSGDTSCGYGSCADSQRPTWTCSSGSCIYQCFGDPACCANECSTAGQTQCSDTGNKQTCGNFDTDICLEWSSSQSCSAGRPATCGYGVCANTEKPVWGCSDNNCGYTCQKDSSCAPSCQDDCVKSGDSQCINSGQAKICGYFDSDPCLDWSGPKDCSGTTSCGALTCNNNQRPSWSCMDGSCSYTCVADSSCGSGPVVCRDECPAKNRTDCADENSTKTCDMNFDADQCLEWGPNRPCDCKGDTSCGSQGCQGSQRPVCKCDNGQCVFICTEDSSCSETATGENGGINGTNNIVCGDGICDQGENISCQQDCQQNTLSIAASAKKSSSSAEWNNSISANSEDVITVRFVVKNNTQHDFSNVLARADIPAEIIYADSVKIDDEDSKNDIRYGIDLGFMPVGSEKSITFKVSVSSKIKTQTQSQIAGTVEAEGTSASNSLKIDIPKPSSGAAWWVWLIAIAMAAAIFVGFLIFKARTPL